MKGNVDVYQGLVYFSEHIVGVMQRLGCHELFLRFIGGVLVWVVHIGVVCTDFHGLIVVVRIVGWVTFLYDFVVFVRLFLVVVVLKVVSIGFKVVGVVFTVFERNYFKVVCYVSRVIGLFDFVIVVNGVLIFVIFVWVLC